MTDLPAAARLRGAAGSEFPTLAHFLVASATRDGEAHTIDAEDEVPDLEAAARCQPDAWRAAVLDLRARAAALAAAVAAARAAAVPGCRFVATMAAPAERARAAVDALEERRLATEARFRRLASFGDDDADRAAPAAFFGALAAFFADLRAARRDNGKRRTAARRAAAARRPAGATAPPRAGGAVAARLATLKTETADDVLAKLRGPRRARGGRAPAPVPASPAAAPSSAAAGGGELLARLERKRGRRRKATR